MRTLYVSDLDGTLMRNDKTISAFTVETINALIAGGGLFAYATARSFTSASRITDRLALNVPVITFTGTFIVDPGTGERIHSEILDRTAAAHLLAALHGVGIYPLVYAFIDGRERVSWVVGRETEAIQSYVATHTTDRRLRPVDEAARLLDGEPFYITIIGTNQMARAAEPLVAQYPQARAHKLEDSYTPGEVWLEIAARHAGKDYALSRLKAMVRADRVVCFGDNLNDIPLFRIADEGYAVANALAALKAVATGVIESNESDGVARFLQMHARSV